MAVNIWQDSTKTIPKGDKNITRIEFDKEDIGARKSHISGVHKKNSENIVHVGSKG